MSFVGDVLVSVRNKSGKVVFSNQLEELVLKAEEAQLGACQDLRSQYCSLSLDVQITTQLHHRINTAIDELTQLQDSVQQEVAYGVKGSVGEVDGLVRKWREVYEGLKSVSLLLSAHKHLDDAHKAEMSHEFHNTAQNLAEVDRILGDASKKEIESQLDVVSALQDAVVIRRMQLVYTVGEVWNETVSWDEERRNNGSRVVTLLIKVGGESSKESLQKLQQMFEALHMLGELQRRIKALGKNLMRYFFRPIINCHAELKMTERSDGYSIQVIQQDSKKGNVPAAIVFMTLQQVFAVLHSSLLCLTIKAGEEEVSLMHLLGREVSEEFTQVLIKECLAEAVPCSQAQLNEYEEVKVAARDFQQFLVDKGFYKPDEMSIMEYAANVDTVFSNKACAHILERARELMVRPVHVLVCITPLEPDSHLVIQDEGGNKLMKSTMRLENLLSAKTFNLPRCQISASMCDLVELIYETMEEACTSSPQHAGRLFYTVRNILSLYCHVVPTAHAYSLATLPQQAAVIHNNSMYLGHHALLLGHQYKNKFPQDLRESILTTVDLGHELRKMATTTFLKALQGHRTALIDTLRESCGLDTIGCNIDGVNKAEQGMRQCLHQLQLLHRVWQTVLPCSVYTKAMGVLISSVIEEVITRVVSLEDISADCALALINLLNLLKDNVPALFIVEGESATLADDVVCYVKLWGKFSELIIVLGASLREILDRWAEGKGPLAHEFTPDEAKQLIRALFQNTDKRAHVLAKIK
ncbi:centromere/kinetochore protein zw10 homolog isoform X1 [Macrobrachium rosenbergii]|uniref:centromere/kinetochore protein zw10 homolog isoform X1 n=1 Tax=Macrobrachium rosenbergii TaxID=79674 RepID=UPI0034D7061D